MIDFEEELKRFSPSLEVSDADENLYKNDLKDITDIVLMMTEDLRKNQGSNDASDVKEETSGKDISDAR